MMEKRVLAMAAGVSGLVIGLAGAGFVVHAQVATSNSVCPTYDAAADAKVDATMKQLHAHDHDRYVPHPASSPFGDAPKPASAEPAKGPSQ